MSDAGHSSALPIRLTTDAGQAVRQLRKAQGLRAGDLAKRMGKSRDTLHRLERGEDVSLGTFLAALATLGHAVTLTRTGLPTMEEMARRFAEDEDDDH
jgi:HTH-type transcriptional regulator/antitoxin HipB